MKSSKRPHVSHSRPCVWNNWCLFSAFPCRWARAVRIGTARQPTRPRSTWSSKAETAKCLVKAFKMFKRRSSNFSDESLAYQDKYLRSQRSRKWLWCTRRTRIGSAVCYHLFGYVELHSHLNNKKSFDDQSSAGINRQETYPVKTKQVIVIESIISRWASAEWLFCIARCRSLNMFSSCLFASQQFRNTGMNT